MKLLPALTTIAVLIALSSPANAAKKRKKAVRHHRAPVTQVAPASVDEPSAATEAPTPGAAVSPEPAETTPDEGPGKSTKAAKDGTRSSEGAGANGAMDFNFFADSSDQSGPAGVKLSPEALELKHDAETRRWMLTTHQTLGIATWILMAATVTIGQLNYNELYGGGGGSTKWQNPHEYLVAATTAAFAATGAFALFAPSPYKKPLRFDTGLVHRLAVAGATLGMLTEAFLGWWTTHQANAGNPNNLRTMARTHQVVGWSTFGFLTIAGAVWVF